MRAGALIAAALLVVVGVASAERVVFETRPKFAPIDTPLNLVVQVVDSDNVVDVSFNGDVGISENGVYAGFVDIVNGEGTFETQSATTETVVYAFLDIASNELNMNDVVAISYQEPIDSISVLTKSVETTNADLCVTVSALDSNDNIVFSEDEVTLLANGADQQTASFELGLAEFCGFSLSTPGTIIFQATSGTLFGSAETEFFNDPCDAAPCQNNGLCVIVPDQVDQYTCICTPEFTGTNCADDIDECATGKCGDKGCINYYGGYSCSEVIPARAPQESPADNNDFSILTDEVVDDAYLSTLMGNTQTVLGLSITPIATYVAVVLAPFRYTRVSWYVPKANAADAETAVTDNYDTLSTLTEAQLNAIVPDGTMLEQNTVPNPLPVAPFNPPLGVTFTDSDPNAFIIGGQLSVTAATDTSDVAGYHVYFAQSCTVQLQGSGAPYVFYDCQDKEGCTLDVAPMALPAGATYLLAVSYSATNVDMAEGKCTPLFDLDCKKSLSESTWVSGASSEFDDSSLAENVMDGNAATSWKSRGMFNQWLEFDLGMNYFLSEVSIVPSNSGVGAFTLQWSESASGSWKDVVSGTMTVADSIESFSFVAKSARYWRLFIKNNLAGDTANYIAVSEVSFRGATSRSRLYPSGELTVENSSSGAGAGVEIFDGDLTTAFVADVAENAYVTFSVGGSALTLDKLRIMPQVGRVRRAKLQYANTANGDGDLNLWNTAASFRIPPSETEFEVSFTPTVSTYWRLTIVNTYDGIDAAVLELELFGFNSDSQEHTTDVTWFTGLVSSPPPANNPTRTGDKIVDNDVDTWWQAGFDAGQYAILDAQSPIAVDRIVISRKKDRLHKGRLECRDSDPNAQSEWKSLASINVEKDNEGGLDPSRYVMTVIPDSLSNNEAFAQSNDAPVCQYFRLFIDNSYDYKIGLKEIDFFGPVRSYQSSNCGTAVLASSAAPGNAVSNINDGNANTHWQATGATADEGYIIFESPNPATPIKYMTIGIVDNGVNQFRVLTSNADTGPWVPVARGSPLTSGGVETTVIFDDEVAAPFIRLEIDSTFDGKPAAISEVICYADTTSYC
jgi:hypothetical protein